MREHLNPLVEIVEGKLVLANLALVAIIGCQACKRTKSKEEDMNSD